MTAEVYRSSLSTFGITTGMRGIRVWLRVFVLRETEVLKKYLDLYKIANKKEFS